MMKVYTDNVGHLFSYFSHKTKVISEKFFYLYEHESERKKMSVNAQKCFYENFESSVVNKQMEEYLISICDKYSAQETRC